MLSSPRRRSVVLLLAALVAPTAQAADAFPLKVSPPEHRRMKDPQTGAELLFLSTDPGEDGNLYYEQRSWLADSSMILFTLGRKEGGLTGYLTQTGELVHLTTPNGGLGCVTAAKSRNSIFGVRDNKIIELALDIRPTADLSKEPSTVFGTERVICELGAAYQPFNCALSESADGKYLSAGVGGRDGNPPDGYGCVLVVNVEAGDVRQVARVPSAEFHGHVMFSLTNPNLLSFKGGKDTSLAVIDIRTSQTVWRQVERSGIEMSTHQCWWVNDSITFCGGFHLKPQEDADVKVANIYTGEIRILGRGNWWPNATAKELATCNWWHSAGHESGHWVAADNWYGDIGLFHGRTTRTYILTKGHRQYGGGRHPEMGWDRKGQQVIFASHMLGNVDVCVATIPQAWQDAWEKE